MAPSCCFRSGPVIASQAPEDSGSYKPASAEEAFGPAVGPRPVRVRGCLIRAHFHEFSVL